MMKLRSKDSDIKSKLQKTPFTSIPSKPHINPNIKLKTSN